jgi:hypothetical protein
MRCLPAPHGAGWLGADNQLRGIPAEARYNLSGCGESSKLYFDLCSMRGDRVITR